MEETLIRRTMPNSLEAEKSVVGSMIMDKDAIVSAMEILTLVYPRTSRISSVICCNNH